MNCNTLQALTKAYNEPMNDTYSLTRLRLPEVDPAHAYTLSSAAALCLSAQSYINLKGLQVSDFPSQEDMDRAIRTNCVWAWERLEQRPDDESLCTPKVASSLPKLLEFVHGTLDEEQRVIAGAFAALFSTASICFNDHLESGASSLKSYMEGDDILPGFQGDEDDFRQALENQQVWTVLDQPETLTMAAGSTLKHALAKAVAAHPNLRLQDRLEAQWPEPELERRKSPRI